jgi:hypothetical protein
VSQFGERLHALDITLFDGIPSQSTGLDRRSLLAAQGAIRARFGSYVYLELGSHLGGSVQTHVMDPACARIYSIDRRPLAQPDARGQDSDYAGNSTARMIENLTRVARRWCREGRDLRHRRQRGVRQRRFRRRRI